MATDPAWFATPDVGLAQVTTANTNRDGTGTTVLLYTGAPTGSIVTRIAVTATGATTAGVVRLFLSNDAGTTKRLIEELIVPAITPSTTVPVWSGQFRRPTLNQPILLPDNGFGLYGSTHNTETFNVHVEAGVA